MKEHDNRAYNYYKYDYNSYKVHLQDQNEHFYVIF